MDDERFLVSVIRVWAALVWADGMVASAEAKALKRVIDDADLSDGARQECLEFLDAEVALDTSDLADLDLPSRAEIYQAAVKFALVDGYLADEESAFLSRLGGALEIDAETAARIEADVQARR